MSTVISDEQAKKNIAANVRRLMKERKLSQTDLANLTKESRMTICRVVNGYHLPGSGLLARVAEALRVPADYLISHSPKKSSKTA